APWLNRGSSCSLVESPRNRTPGPRGPAGARKESRTSNDPGAGEGTPRLEGEASMVSSSDPRSADVIVLGGGAIGLQIARQLNRAGRAVTLLERGQPGQQASWASAGIVGDRFPNATDPLSLLRHPCVEG